MGHNNQPLEPRPSMIYCALIREIGLREMDCGDERWMKLAQDHVQWWALRLAVLNLWILLAQLVHIVVHKPVAKR
jgi:hypothetical protein